jgi:hypothetical protein
VEDLLEGLVLHRYSLRSGAAPLAFQVAAEGDEVALEIIRWAGRELASLAIGVIRQLDLQQEPDLEVVQIGSLYDGSPLLGNVMLSTIQTVAPGARLVRLTVPPVIGGVLLGMEQADIAYATRRQVLIETTERLFDREATQKLAPGGPSAAGDLDGSPPPDRPRDALQG